MKNRITLYFFLLLLWWVIGCEFEVPTMPRLPARWNSKVILPFLKKTYSFQELLFDSLADRSNTFFVNGEGTIYYEAIDSGEQVLQVDSSYWIIPATDPIIRTVDLGQAIDGDSGDVAKTYRMTVAGQVNTSNSRIYKGLITSSTTNQIYISASLTDSLRNNLKIRFTAQNFKDTLAHKIVIDSLFIPSNALSVSGTIEVFSDSIIATYREHIWIH